MNLPNIPFVPEGALDPAAGTNDAINVLKALVQTNVLAIDQDSPPGSPEDDDMYIVSGTGGTATGDWSGQENNLARYVSDGDFWKFYAAGDEVSVIVNRDDGDLYIFSSAGSGGGSWVVIAQSSGTLMVTESSTNLDASPWNSGNYTRFTNAGAKTYTFDGSAGLVPGDEYTARNAGAGDLTITATGGLTLNAPYGGGPVVKQGGTVTIKVVDVDEVDIIGQTFP